MEISQKDRDRLRAHQQQIHTQTIGRFVEHQVQNPHRYKEISRGRHECGDKSNWCTKESFQYKSKYYCDEPKLVPTPNEVNGTDRESLSSQEGELPISMEDVLTNEWINMSKFESEKLEWLSAKAQELRNLELNAKTRFDRLGRVLPAPSDTSKQPEGHDVDELIELLDSSYPPKVTFALNVIAKIATNASLGYYDGAFDQNIHEIFLRRGLLRVRHHLDSSNETTCQSAIKCLRALVCNTDVDEIVMDRIFPLAYRRIDDNLWLQTPSMESQVFTQDMKDSQCIEIDALLALVERTNILPRFCYLLRNKERENRVYQECILDILIRLARHSPRMCYLLCVKELLDPIIELFLPVSVLKGRNAIRNLSVKALKLYRIITQAIYEVSVIHKITSEREYKIARVSEILNVIGSFYHIDCFGLQPEKDGTLLRLHIETLRLAAILFRLEKFRHHIIDMISGSLSKVHDDLVAISNVPIRTNSTACSKISFEWNYAAHLLNLLGVIVRHERQGTRHLVSPAWCRLVEPLMLNWVTIITREKIIPNIDASIALSTGIYFWDYNSGRTPWSVLCGTEPRADATVHEAEFIKGDRESLDLFNELLGAASRTSQLARFSDKNGKRRDPTGLPSFGCLSYNNSVKDQFAVTPLMDNQSPFIMLRTYLTLLLGNTEATGKHLKPFANNDLLIRYIKNCLSYHSLPLTHEQVIHDSFLAQFEAELIADAVLLYTRFCFRFDEDRNEFNCNRLETPRHLETAQLAHLQIEDYSHMCLYVISVLGLLNSTRDFSAGIRDDLLKEVLLNQKVHSRLATSWYQRKYDDSNECETGLSSKERFRQGVVELHDFRPKIIELHDDDLAILTTIYTSCTQTNRYWLFEPIFRYYNGRIKSKHETEPGTNFWSDEEEAGHWFRKNLPIQVHTSQFTRADDSKIFAKILEFNAAMLHFSPDYAQTVVRPTAIDHLCLLGSLYLDDDLFLDAQVSGALASNLRLVLRECIHEKTGQYKSPTKDATRKIALLDLPLADFFNQLVDQFEAVSYGDDGFSNFLLLFIEPQSDIVFKRKLLEEKAETCLRQMRVINNLWTPREIFLTSQRETNREALALLRRARAYTRTGYFLRQYIDHHLQLP